MDTSTIAATTGAALLGGTLIQPIVDATKSAGLASRFASLAAILVGALLGGVAGIPGIVDGGDATILAVTIPAGLVSGVMASRNYSAASNAGEAKAEERFMAPQEPPSRPPPPPDA